MSSFRTPKSNLYLCQGNCKMALGKLQSREKKSTRRWKSIFRSEQEIHFLVKFIKNQPVQRNCYIKREKTKLGIDLKGYTRENVRWTRIQNSNSKFSNCCHTNLNKIQIVTPTLNNKSQLFLFGVYNFAISTQSYNHRAHRSFAV